MQGFTSMVSGFVRIIAWFNEVLTKADAALAWERLRRPMRDSYLDRAGLGLIGFFGGLLAIRSKVDDASPFSKISIELLLESAYCFAIYFMVWSIVYLFMILYCPRIYLDYENKEKYVDAQLKTHDSSRRSAYEQFRIDYITAWDSLNLSKKAARWIAAFLMITAFSIYLRSLALSLQSIYHVFGPTT